MQNLSSKDFFEPTTFNQETKNQLWMSLIADSHDSICKCETPFAHLLANIFPPGHKDRGLTIQEILHRDYIEKCRSGGGGAAAAGYPEDTTRKGKHAIEEKEPGYIPDEDLEDLIAAGEDAAGTR